jgi:hypothetical protein
MFKLICTTTKDFIADPYHVAIVDMYAEIDQGLKFDLNNTSECFCLQHLLDTCEEDKAPRTIGITNFNMNGNSLFQEYIK